MFKSLLINTLLKEYRNKVFIILFILTIVFTILFNGVLNFIFDEVVDQSFSSLVGNQAITVFFFGINIWAIVLSALIGCGLIKSDVETDTIPQLLSFPIPRRTYLLSRLLGGWIIVMSYYLISLILAVVLISISSQSFNLGVSILGALVSVGVNLFCVLCLSLLVSNYFPKIISFLMVMFLLLLISISNQSLAGSSGAEMFSNVGFIKGIGLFIHWFLPQLGTLNEITSSLILGKGFPKGMIGFILHFAVINSFIAICGNQIFKNKEF